MIYCQLWMLIIDNSLDMFRASLCLSSGEKTTFYCIWSICAGSVGCGRFRYCGATLRVWSLWRLLFEQQPSQWSGRLLTMFREDISNNFTKGTGYFSETLLKVHQTTDWYIPDDHIMNTKGFCLVGSNAVLSGSTCRSFGIFRRGAGRFIPGYTA